MCKATNKSSSEVASLIEALRNDPATLHRTAQLELHESPPEHRFVLLVDQFEETFTLCTDKIDQSAFINNLIHHCDLPDSRLIVVLTMRSDFYHRCAVNEQLADAISENQRLICPLNEQELRDAIIHPAQLAGIEFEPGLVESLVRDVVDKGPGGLPLLQHALMELWQKREPARITIDAYNEIGGVNGALQLACRKNLSRDVTQ